MNRIAVTGGSGKLGSHILSQLKELYDVVNIDIKPSALHQDVTFRQVNLLDFDRTCKALSDIDVIVHLAAIPDPSKAPLDEVMKVNTVCTYNVMEAMLRVGIKHIVYGSSDSATGFGIHKKIVKPHYLPIDAEHPCCPHESYSFSKYFGEIMCKEYSLIYNINTIILRFMGIWYDSLHEDIENRVLAKVPDKPNCWLGSYVLPQDAAQAVDLSIEYLNRKDLPGYEIFFVHAPQTFLTVDTLTQAKQIWGKLPEIRDAALYEKNPRAPFFDISTAREKLGYEPELTWQFVFSR